MKGRFEPRMDTNREENRSASQSYLLVTEDDFAKAAGVAKVTMDG